MKDWAHLPKKELLASLEVDIDTGLTSKEAQNREKVYGTNELEKRKKASLLKRILLQLKDVSTIVLLIAIALSFLLAFIENSGYVEPFVILAIVVLNIVLALVQEGKAEQALEALGKLNAPTCTVLRDGNHKEIDTSELVPGDIIILVTGDIIPADARLLESVGLSSDESALTGESEPSDKDADSLAPENAPIGDWSNMVFSGCVISTGHARAVVVATGMNSQMGLIARSLKGAEQEKTPLQVRLDKLGKMISWIAIIAALILLANGLREGTDIGTMIMVAISLAVAAVPETLTLIVTLSLTTGVQKMVKKNALIRKLQAVETLGSTSVICSDKTGTLTQNRMAITRLWLYGEDPFPATCDFSASQTRFLEMLALASNATVEEGQNGEAQVSGNATEIAIMHLVREKDISLSTLEDKNPKRAEIPFSSERKKMTVVVEEEDGRLLVLSKGALDRLSLESLPAEEAQHVSEIHDSFANDALRVLAIGYKYIDSLPDDDDLDELEQGLSLLGLIGIIDPPRPEVAGAIQRAKNAGIRTIMITGDHAATATSIAKEIGILTEGKCILTGTELAEMSEQKLHDTVRSYAVYARVSPQDKIRIVKAWQANNEVVAMTGDGVNDAPALKAADVGVAMGQTGTDVSKNAADIILTDDNFVTIVDAVEEGRNVYENITKTVYFLLVCSFTEILVMLFAQMAGWGIMLTPIMLLLINLLGDGIPGLQLSREVSDEDLMERCPIERNKSFFTGSMLRKVIRQVIACSIAALAAFYLGVHWLDPNTASSVTTGQTMAFLVVGWTAILHIFHVRTNKSIFRSSLRGSRALTLSAFAMVLSFALIVATPLGVFFGFTDLSIAQWLVAIGLTLLPTLIREIGRPIDNCLDEQKRVEDRKEL